MTPTSLDSELIGLCVTAVNFYLLGLATNWAKAESEYCIHAIFNYVSFFIFILFFDDAYHVNDELYNGL